MNALNQIILEGNLTRDVTVRDFQNGSKVCTLPIAVNRRYKTSEGTFADDVSYFEVDTYGNLADACAQWCPKGRGIRVVGRLKQNRWTDEEGKAHSKVKVIAEHIEFKPMPKKTPDEKAEETGPNSAYAGNPDESKKEKIAQLAEAALAAQKEGDNPEVVF